ELEATAATCIAVTGAEAALSIDGKPVDSWRSHRLDKGMKVSIGMASAGIRVYLAVSGGFDIPLIFSSAATVVREGIGGLHGNALEKGDFLPFTSTDQNREFILPPQLRPAIADTSPLRVIPCWQAKQLPRTLKKDFFQRSEQRAFILS